MRSRTSARMTGMPQNRQWKSIARMRLATLLRIGHARGHTVLARKAGVPEDWITT